MALTKPSSQATLIKPDAAAGGGGNRYFLSYDDKDSEVIPASVTAGTITMSGNTWQLRGFTTTTRHQGMTQGWRIEYPVPSGFMDGTNKALLFRIKFTSDPTTASNIGVRVGFHETSRYGVGGGLDYGTSAGTYRATLGLLSSTTKGAIVAGTEAKGVIQVPGNWNGVNAVAGSGASSIYTATVTSGAGDENASSTTSTLAGSMLTVHIGNGTISSSGPDDCDFEIEVEEVTLLA